MQLTEQHILSRGDPRFALIDRAAFAAKNLYNAATYLVRQSFIFQGAYLNYYDVHAQMKAHEAYQAELQAKLEQPGRTKRMERLITRRTRQINHYLHTHSRRIIDLLVAEGVGTLVIGKNK